MSQHHALLKQVISVVYYVVRPDEKQIFTSAFLQKFLTFLFTKESEDFSGLFVTRPS